MKNDANQPKSWTGWAMMEKQLCGYESVTDVFFAMAEMAPVLPKS